MQIRGLEGLALGLRAAAAIVLALGVGLLASQQVSAQDETVSIGRVTVAPGEHASVDLEALDFLAPGLGAWEIGIYYDPAVVTAVACSPRAGSVCNADFAPNQVRVTGARATGLQGDGTLASIIFRCESQGASALALGLDVLADATTGDPQPIDAAAMQGSITCTTGPTPAATPGDANCNGAVNSADASLVLRYDAGLIASLPCPENADVDGDGGIDSRDAALILQFDAGLIIG